MDDREYAQLVSRARRVSTLSSNDVYELKRVYSSGLKPFASELHAIMGNAFRDDDAVLLKVAILGISSLSSSELYRFKEATEKRGKRVP